MDVMDVEVPEHCEDLVDLCVDCHVNLLLVDDVLHPHVVGDLRVRSLFELVALDLLDPLKLKIVTCEFHTWGRAWQHRC